MTKSTPHGRPGLDLDRMEKTLEELEEDIAALREDLKRVREESTGPLEDEYLLAYA